MDKTTRAEGTVHRDSRGREHDSEDTSRRGMSSDATAADEAETMASTGDSESAFQEIAAGTATGWGIDRGESVGTGGLAAGEDLDEVAEGDYWRQNFRRRQPWELWLGGEDDETSAWMRATSPSGQAEYEGRDFDDVESELERSWDALHGENAQEWEEAREVVRDGWHRARERSG